MYCDSIDKVMAGKHYNRAIRVHQLMLDANERLLLEAFEAFLIQHDNDLHIPNELQTVAESPTTSKILLYSLEFISLVADFNFFRQQVRLEKLGSTVKFWILYMKCVASVAFSTGH